MKQAVSLELARLVAEILVELIRAWGQKRRDDDDPARRRAISRIRKLMPDASVEEIAEMLDQVTASVTRRMARRPR